MGRGKPPAPALPLTERQRGLLEAELSKRTTLRQYSDRIPVILLGSTGQSNGATARELGLALNTIKYWRRRWEISYPILLEFEKGKEGKGVSDHELRIKMLECFEDAPRSGAPIRITQSQKQQIVALACEKPKEYGIAVTDWSLELLAKVAIARGIVDRITSRYVGEILKNERTSST